MVTGTVPEGSRTAPRSMKSKSLECDAVDGKDIALDIEIVFEDRADQPGEILIED